MLYEPDPEHLMVHMGGTLAAVGEWLQLSEEEGYDVWTYNEALIAIDAKEKQIWDSLTPEQRAEWNNL